MLWFYIPYRSSHKHHTYKIPFLHYRFNCTRIEISIQKNAQHDNIQVEQNMRQYFCVHQTSRQQSYNTGDHNFSHLLRCKYRISHGKNQSSRSYIHCFGVASLHMQSKETTPIPQHMDHEVQIVIKTTLTSLFIKTNLNINWQVSDTAYKNNRNTANKLTTGDVER